MSQKKPKARLSTALYILVCIPFLTNIDLNDVIFPFTVAIFGNCFGVVCLSSSSCSIFVHPFLSDSVRLVSSSIMTMNQEMDILAVYFIDKPSVSVSVKFLIRWSINHCISCKNSVPSYWLLWLTITTGFVSSYSAASILSPPLPIAELITCRRTFCTYSVMVYVDSPVYCAR